MAKAKRTTHRSSTGKKLYAVRDASGYERFRSGDFTAGLVLGIERAGETLARHFPRVSPGPNLFPDDIDLGPRHPPA